MVVLKLRAGDALQLVEIDGDRVVALSTTVAPAGSTLEGSVADDSGVVRIKVRGCRIAAGDSAARFRVEGRLVGLTRAQRQRLLR